MRAIVEERAIIGNLIFKPSLLAKTKLTDEHFNELKEKKIFRAIKKHSERMQDDKIESNMDVIVSEIDDSSKLSFSDLIEYAPTSDHLFFLDVEALNDAMQKRKLLDVANAIKERMSIAEIRDAYKEALDLLDTSATKENSDWQLFSEIVLTEYQEMLGDLAKRERGEFVGSNFPSGIFSLDQLIEGFPIGVPSIVAARPSEGKSALALNIADNLASKGIGVHLFSYEDGVQSFYRRWVSKRVRIPIHELTPNQINQGCIRAIGKVNKRTAEKLIIQTAHGLNIDEITKCYNATKEKLGTRVVIIDYLQLMPGVNGKQRHEQLEDNMIKIATLAAKEQISVIVLSQLNRESAKREGDNKPRLSDLRGSGSIEQIGKLIVALHSTQTQKEMDMLGLYVLKNSQGRCGDCLVSFEREFCDIK